MVIKLYHGQVYLLIIFPGKPVCCCSVYFYFCLLSECLLGWTTLLVAFFSAHNYNAIAVLTQSAKLNRKWWHISLQNYLILDSCITSRGSLPLFLSQDSDQAKRSCPRRSNKPHHSKGKSRHGNSEAAHSGDSGSRPPVYPPSYTGPKVCVCVYVSLWHILV